MDHPEAVGRIEIWRCRWYNRCQHLVLGFQAEPQLGLHLCSSADQSENRGAAESHTNADELAARRRFQLSADFLIRVKLAKSADGKRYFNTTCSRSKID